MNMKIKVSKYNEVAPSELKRLLKLGARIIGNHDKNVGVVIDYINEGHYPLTAITTTDIIRINNVELPLAVGEDSYFDNYVEIN